MPVYTVENNLRSVRKVYLDGVDVTRDCFLADTNYGIVHLYCRNENNAWFMKTLPSGEKGAAFEVKIGKVVVELKEEQK